MALTAFGPFENQGEAIAAASQALDVIHDPKTPVPMTTDVHPVELKPWEREEFGR